MSKNTDTETQWLRSVILPKLLENGKLVENVETPPNVDAFKVHDIAISFIGAEEAFMLTTCYRATVKFEYAGIVGTRSLVIKKTPELPEFLFDSINFKALFNNELTAYEKIIPELERFAGVSLHVPKYYYSNLQRASATIVLGDFGADGGYRMTNDKVNLSLEHVLVGVKYLANFHGIGFAWRQVQRSSFDSTTSTLLESRYANEVLHQDYKLLLESTKLRIGIVAKKYQPEVTESFVKKLMDLISNDMRYGKQRVAPKEPLVTLCHGDYLRNNIAYKYKDGGLADEPQASMMFDLQTMRLSSPMLDLATFLALSTFAEVRYTHFSLIFSTYCTELGAAYERHAKQAVPQYLSQDTLLKEYIRFLPYSINITAAFLMNIVVPLELTSENMLLQQRTPEEIKEDALTRGGDVVDRELAHQLKELYELSIKHDVDISEGIVL